MFSLLKSHFSFLYCYRKNKLLLLLLMIKRKYPLKSVTGQLHLTMVTNPKRNRLKNARAAAKEIKRCTRHPPANTVPDSTVLAGSLDPAKGDKGGGAGGATVDGTLGGMEAHSEGVATTKICYSQGSSQNFMATIFIQFIITSVFMVVIKTILTLCYKLERVYVPPNLIIPIIIYPHSNYFSSALCTALVYFNWLLIES